MCNLGNVGDPEEEGVNEKDIGILKNKSLLSVRFVTLGFVVIRDHYNSPAVVTWLKLTVNFSAEIEAQDDGGRLLICLQYVTESLCSVLVLAINVLLDCGQISLKFCGLQVSVFCFMFHLPIGCISRDWAFQNRVQCQKAEKVSILLLVFPYPKI